MLTLDAYLHVYSPLTDDLDQSSDDETQTSHHSEGTLLTLSLIYFLDHSAKCYNITESEKVQTLRLYSSF